MSKLTRLLRERMQMLREDAAAVAKVVEEAFAGHSELDDDILDPQLRQVFYDLEDEKILQVRRQEYVLDGRERRGYFWSIDGQSPLRPTAAPPAADELEALYGGLRDRAWARRRA